MTIVVTGATGNVGSALLDLLRDGDEEVVAVSRSRQPDDSTSAVRWAQADTGRAASLQPALEGARAVFLLLAGELNNRGEIPAALIDAVSAAAPERIVLLSSLIAGTRPESASHARLAAYEEQVRQSGLPYSILHPGGFASNALGWSDTVRSHRTVYAPFGDVALPDVDPLDVAAVAAAALREDGHAGRTYRLTGPQALSPRQKTAILSDALGDHLTFVEVSREDAYAAMLEFMAEEMAVGSLDVLGTPLASEQEVTPEVERVTGRPASSFASWAARHVEAFR